MDFPCPFTAIATVFILITYMWTGIVVGKARKTHGVDYPATSGPDAFNRIWRAHMNTLEQLPLILVPMWLFAALVGDPHAAILGLVWIIGRILYVQGYAQAPEKRSTGFLIGFLASVTGLLGSLGVALWQILA
jgi:glutathione S-transferase